MKRTAAGALILTLCLLCGCGAVTPTPTLTPNITPSPSPTPEPELIRARELLSGMSLREKLCQLMITRPEAISGGKTVTEADAEFIAALENTPVGGIIFGLDNLVTREQTLKLTEAVRAASPLGLIVCADEEGGNVGRLMYKLDTTYFHDMYSYRAQGQGRAWANAYVIGADLLSCGFNTDLAPVADVWTNPDNRVIGPRAYSDDYGEAAMLVAAAVDGFRASGVLCCLKHFPGHGDTLADTHEGAAVLNKTREELKAGELLPFIAGIDAGADMVMTGHLIVPEIDSLPASLSYELTTELLRNELGWNGVIITDALSMGALAEWTEAERCIMALGAGADILLGVDDIEACVEALGGAVDTGTLTLERVNESVMRVLLLKLRRGLLE